MSARNHDRAAPLAAVPVASRAGLPRGQDVDPTARAFAYWGKSRPRRDSAAAVHLLPFHSLDVAAVGIEALRRLGAVNERIAQCLRLPQPESASLVAFWLALHDLGKFAESFQSQSPEAFFALRHRPPDPAKPYTLRHDSLGMLFWSSVMRERVIADRWFGLQSFDLCDGLDFWARACTGHHGQPPTEGDHWGHHFDVREDRDAALDFVESARRMFVTDALVEALAAQDPTEFWRASRELSWWLAGLAVLADWLGSNTMFFPYHDQPLPLPEYWLHAQRQAAAALDASGIAAPARAAPLSFSGLFPQIREPSPLQRWAASAPLGEGPQIHLLEDVTGAGKTEAALMLTHRLLAHVNANGFYVALPTMATANAMYTRVAATYRRLFADPASLVLASSQRTLVEEFAATVLPADASEHDPSQLDETASARCSAWLADHNKRALLAPAGVGTIDQALLAVLHSRHQSLRLLGLVGKVLLVDEVHACDAYMQAVLERLLEFHARAGGSAILLSATLPLRMKRRLLAAFARGTGDDDPPRPQAESFPLTCSWRSGGGIQEQAVATRPDVRRTVRVNTAASVADIVAIIERALSAGRCVCWVRNTVADAVDAFELFHDRLPAERLLLFHARFALRDRLRLEEQVLGTFGKDSGAAQRAGRLLVATQVVEQSLDVDFDVLVSDLAPIDRIIQRAGRLARHRRAADGSPMADHATPDQRGQPVLWVLTPPWSDAPEAGWFKSAFPKAAAVYPDHGQLWLTLRGLREGTFTMPDDARRLIEGVFGERAEVPAGLQPVALAAEGQGFAAQAQAQMNALTIGTGYVRSGIDWWSDAKTPSRLGEATSTVALARWVGGVIEPWAEAASPAHAWAYSSLRVAARHIDAEAPMPDPAQQAAIDAVRESLPAQGRWTVLLPLTEHDGRWTGEALATARRGESPLRLRWTYDIRRGLRLLPDNDRIGDSKDHPAT